VHSLFIIYKKYRSFCPVKQPENAFSDKISSGTFEKLRHFCPTLFCQIKVL